MEKLGEKAIYVAAAFTSVAAIGVYAYWEDVSFALCERFVPDWNAGEGRLTDADGRRFTLLNQGDGKETALYDDDTAVTFHRDAEGNLVWDYGTASLLSAIAGSYFAFHGLHTASGHMDVASMTYRVQGKPTPLLKEGEEKPASGMSRGWGHGGGYGGSNYETKKSDRAHLIGRRSGFGKAGIRSSGSS